MRAALALLQREPRARWFFAALGQSALGTGAAYVGLLLIAYDSFHSAWAISLILLAEFFPSMVLGSVLGAAADRWSRRWCVVIADLIRAAAFVGIGFVDGFVATLAFALAAGFGTALFRPAALAGLPALVAERRLPAATALFSAVSNLSWVVGPAIAGAVLIATDPRDLMLANGVTFLISAVVLARIPLDRPAPQLPAPEDVPPRRSLIIEAVHGGRAVAGMVDIRVVMLATTGAMFFGGVFNVGELIFASDALGVGGTGYSALVAVYGLGFLVGSLSGSAGGEPPRLTRRYVQGLALTGLGSLCTALAPTLAIALGSFALGGFGNGLFAAYERLLIQRRVPGELHGRAFALEDTMVSWALASAFLIAGGVAALLGARGLMFATATGELIVAALAFVALRQRMAQPHSPLAAEQGR
jgi:MFS family permease